MRDKIANFFKSSYPISWVLLLAFLIRLLLPLLSFILTKELAIFYGGDTASYLKPATELVASGRFTSEGFPEIFRAPGYSLMLVPGILLNQIEWVTVAVQIALSCWTVYLVFKIALLVFEGNNKIAVICAFLYAVEPLSIIYPGKLLTETAFTSLVFGFLYCFLKYLNYQAFIWLLVSSILLSVSTYIRPIAYYLPFLFTLILVILVLTKFQNKRIILLHGFLFLSLSMGSIYLWNIRNKVVAGYSGFSSVTEINLYYWHAGAVLMAKQGTTFSQQQQLLLAKLQQVVPPDVFQAQNKVHLCNCAPDYGSPRILKYMREEGKKIIFAHPFLYLKLRLNGMLNLMFNSTPWPFLTLFNKYKIGGFVEIADQYMAEFYSKGWWAGMSYYLNKAPLDVSRTWLVLQINLVLYLLLTFIGLITKNFFKPIPSLMLITLGFYFLVITGGPEGASSRYRHPIMPIICIIAGYGLYFVIEEFKEKVMKKTTFSERE
jgi:Dolichyl-phosphate-mannose-protein mannosyltransferase